MILYWVFFVGIVLTGAYALVNTGHYANRTPRQRIGVIALFLICVIGFLIGPRNIRTIWDSFTETHQQSR